MKFETIITKCQKLKILVVAFAWLLTAFILISNTDKKADASNIILTDHFEQSNISLSDIHFSATDYMLDVSIEPGVDDEYYIKGPDWSYFYLGSIGFNGKLLAFHFASSHDGLFDPYSIESKKYILGFKIIACTLIGFMFFTFVSFVLLDKYVFLTVLQNCKRSGNNISWFRTWREIRHLFRLILKVFVVIALYLFLNATFLILCHEYIVPIPTVIKIFSYFDANPDRWESNIEIGKFGDTGAEYEQWSKERGFSPKTTRFWQEFLWHNWYILIGLILYFGLSFYFSIFKFCLKMLTRYKIRVSRRRRFYIDVDRHRLFNKTLVTDPTVSSGNKSESISNK